MKTILNLFLILNVLLTFNSAQAQELPKNVVLIVVDTFRADHLGVYGAKNSPSPNIDKLAKDGVVFNKALSPAPWTKPSVSSMFTGLLPSYHGVRSIDTHLDPKHVTLAERLKKANWTTAGFISHILITPKMGYAQGFDTYDTIPFKGNIHNVVSSEKVTDLALNWLKDYKTKKSQDNFFLFLHYFDPHNNYHHHEKFDRSSWHKGDLKPGMQIKKLRKHKFFDDDLKYLKNLYDEEIAFTDSQIGKFIYTLNELKLFEDTLVILTADHGEEFLDRGFIGHTRTLFDELIHVPFIFHHSKSMKAGRVNNYVTTMDLTPTLLDLFNLPLDNNFNGKSLKKSILLGEEPTNRDIYSEVDFKSSDIKANLIGINRGDFKFVYDVKTNKHELYDRKTDPREKVNVANNHKQLVDELSEYTNAYLEDYMTNRQTQENNTKPIRNENEIKQLESLGYL